MARVKIGNVRTPIDYLKQFFATAGFGYGDETMQHIDGSESDLENIISEILVTMKNKSTKQISFTCSDGTLYGRGRFVATICKNDSQYAHIYATTYNNYAVMKSFYNGTWKPFEWANPPMAINVEYRTTERFKEKPVYRKIVAYKLSSTTNTDFSVPHGISNYDTLVRQTASVGAGIPLPYTHNGNTTCVKELDATNIKVSNTGQSWDSSYTWNFYLYYTKTTD